MKRILGLAMAACIAAASPARADGTPTIAALKLLNGWTAAPFGTRNPVVQSLNGVISFKGAIATTGNNGVAFVLQPAYRPKATVYVPVDTCDATKGRLMISTDGSAFVQGEAGFSNPQCFTSLEGASFVRDAQGYVPLVLANGWTSSPFSTAPVPAAKEINGIIRFTGALSTGGTSAVAFTLPPAQRPAAMVYIPVDMCNATNGRIVIAPTGTVTVQPESDFANAQCFTSLDGAHFSRHAGKPLTLLNGWVGQPFATGAAQVKLLDGVIHLQGAIATSGTNAQPFVLPAGFRPAKPVYVHADFCNATNGRLLIQASGAVQVQAASDLANAQCFTSLDGVSFVK